MKKTTTSILVFALLFATSNSIEAQQAFHKGMLTISISEGHTLAAYSTHDVSDPAHQSLIKRSLMLGDRDPLFIDFGVSRQWSIGLSTGSDIFHVNPQSFYNFKSPVKDLNDKNLLKVGTNEANLECSYHFFVTKKLDLSAFSSAGMFSVEFKNSENDNETPFKYTSNGTIFRFGTRARYYFWRRLGAFGMVSMYRGKSSPKDVKDNTVATNISTNINGFAIETGLCFKILK